MVCNLEMHRSRGIIKNSGETAHWHISQRRGFSTLGFNPVRATIRIILGCRRGNLCTSPQGVWEYGGNCRQPGYHRSYIVGTKQSICKWSVKWSKGVNGSWQTGELSSRAFSWYLHEQQQTYPSYIVTSNAYSIRNLTSNIGIALDFIKYVFWGRNAWCSLYSVLSRHPDARQTIRLTRCEGNEWLL